MYVLGLHSCNAIYELIFFDPYEAGFPLFEVLLLTNAPLGVTMTLTWGALY